MKRFVLITALISSNAMALDFKTEWARFSDDFARIRSRVVKVEPKEEPKLAPVEDAEVKLVDPKSPERLGLKLQNQAMVKKLKELYNRDDVVVYTTTVR